MSDIVRYPGQAAKEKFDVGIVGGGIYGAMIMLEAARAGLRPLLIEKADFGSSTSFNNLRIVHGGLRYLQTAHLSRFRESVAERRWWLCTFPELVRPLPCLMPLYGGLLKNRFVLRIALATNDWLSRARNEGLQAESRLPGGKLLSPAETRERFPLVRRDGLRGSALWYDAVMPDCNRLLIEVLRWAVAAGGTALNYVEANELLTSANSVAGIAATDRISMKQLEFQCDTVINAAGPESGSVARMFASEPKPLFRPSLAWNLLLDRAPLSDSATAVQAPVRNSRIYFAHSLGGKLLLGTGHAPLRDATCKTPSAEQNQKMLEEVNLAVPGLGLTTKDIIRVFSGQLPAQHEGTAELADTPICLDHGTNGGPKGLISVSGVKYTTARDVASSAVSQVIQASPAMTAKGLPERPAPNPYELHPAKCVAREERIERARLLIRSECPQTIEDLLFRRSNLVSDPETAYAQVAEASEAFGWDQAEINRNTANFAKSLRSAAADSHNQT